MEYVIQSVTNSQYGFVVTLERDGQRTSVIVRDGCQAKLLVGQRVRMQKRGGDFVFTRVFTDGASRKRKSKDIEVNERDA
jgi:hypothetical protein